MTAAAAVRGRAFAVVAAVLGLFLVAAAAPSPLYGLYAARWHFSPVSVTAVFAVYALALLAALLLAGSVSDSVGRRPVIATGLLLEAVALGLFVAADGLAWLYAARVVQGVATGLVTAAVSAALLDLQPPGRAGAGALVNAVVPSFGLAGGALLSGALVQHAPAPTRLVYLVLLVGVAGLLLALRTVPETVPDRRRPRLTLRLGLEPAVRPAFLAALPCLVAAWALSGLYLSLGPSLVLQLAGSTDRLVGGSAVGVLAGAGGLASLVAQSWAPHRAMVVGCVGLSAGVAVTAAGIGAGSPAVFFAGTAVAGLGFGTAFLGAFRLLAGLARPDRRGELLSTVYVASYLAFSVPAVVAGLVSRSAGLRDTALGYAVVVGVLAAVAVPATLRALARSRRAAAQGRRERDDHA